MVTSAENAKGGLKLVMVISFGISFILSGGMLYIILFM